MPVRLSLGPRRRRYRCRYRCGWRYFVETMSKKPDISADAVGPARRWTAAPRGVRGTAVRDAEPTAVPRGARLVALCAGGACALGGTRCLRCTWWGWGSESAAPGGCGVMTVRFALSQSAGALGAGGSTVSARGASRDVPFVVCGDRSDGTATLVARWREVTRWGGRRRVFRGACTRPGGEGPELPYVHDNLKLLGLDHAGNPPGPLRLRHIPEPPPNPGKPPSPKPTTPNTWTNANVPHPQHALRHRNLPISHTPTMGTTAHNTGSVQPLQSRATGRTTGSGDSGCPRTTATTGQPHSNSHRRPHTPPPPTTRPTSWITRPSPPGPHKLGRSPRTHHHEETRATGYARRRSAHWTRPRGLT